MSKEIRHRLWWALYSLDIQLCSMTGRPPNIDLEYCTTPLPVPYQEADFLEDRVSQFIADKSTSKCLMTSSIPQAFNADREGGQQHAKDPRRPVVSGGKDNYPAPDNIKPNTSLYFLCCIGLTCIGRSAMDEIHSPTTALLSWDDLEASITRNNASADDWLAKLPSEYHFEKSSSNCPFVRQRTSLAFQYYSTKLIILEPCLRRAIDVVSDGPCSKHCQAMATMCMQVAGSVLDLFPDKADVRWLYEYCPWWSMLHYIMQCSAILLGGLVGQINLGSVGNAATVHYIKKACGWLSEMSKTDEFSRRAWGIFHELAIRHNPNLVPLSAPSP